jgi:hypothetical protein
LAGSHEFLLFRWRCNKAYHCCGVSGKTNRNPGSWNATDNLRKGRNHCDELQLLPELQHEDREQVHKICRMVLYGITARKPEKPVNRQKMPKQQKAVPQVIAVAYKPVKRSFYYPRDLNVPE